MSEIKTIGVITSGGDAPGMNAFVYGATETGKSHGIQMLGIPSAFGPMVEATPVIYDLNKSPIEQFMRDSGTELGSNSNGRDLSPEALENIARNIERYQIDALAVIGGDGTMRYLLPILEKAGVKIPIVAAPKTIDNDVPFVDQTLGFDSAAQLASEMIRANYRTAKAMGFIQIIQTMGRGCGDLALVSAARSKSADIVLVHDFEYNMESLVNALDVRWQAGQRHAVIVVSEGIRSLDGGPLIVGYKEDKTPIMGDAKAYIRTELVHMLEAELKGRGGDFFNPKSIRCQEIGHAQRGAPVSDYDLHLGIKLGCKVVQALLGGKSGIILTHTGTPHKLEIAERTVDEINGAVHASSRNHIEELGCQTTGVSLGYETRQFLEESFGRAQKGRSASRLVIATPAIPIASKTPQTLAR